MYLIYKPLIDITIWKHTQWDINDINCIILTYDYPWKPASNNDTS